MVCEKCYDKKLVPPSSIEECECGRIKTVGYSCCRICSIQENKCEICGVDYDNPYGD
jgi:hypothetical protein